jgi:hypothetical protein
MSRSTNRRPSPSPRARRSSRSIAVAVAVAATLAGGLGCPNKGPIEGGPDRPEAPRGIAELPPALPKGLTPPEARSQSADVAPVAASLVGKNIARLSPEKAPIGYARFVVDAPASSPAPAMRLVSAKGGGAGAIGPFGPAAKFSTKDPNVARWEFFAIIDPNDPRAIEFFYP